MKMIATSFNFSVVILAALTVLASGKPIRRPVSLKASADTPTCNNSNLGAWACIPNRAECYGGAWHSVPCEPGTVCQGGLCVWAGGAGGSSSSPSSSPSSTTNSASSSTSTSVSTTVTQSQKSSSTSSQPSPTSKPPPPSTGAKFVTYIDATGASSDGSVFAVPGNSPKSAYNIINLSFWQSYGPWDAAKVWSDLDSPTQQSYVDAYHKAGMKVVVSAFGSAEWPTTAGVDPTTAANNLAQFVKGNGLDGADIDWEDNNAMQAGTGEQWLITFTTQLRNQLPKPYIISHAPQAPYFINDKQMYSNGAYLTVDSKVGDMIDFYNVQFYNQGDSRYDTCDTLLTSSGGAFPGTSLFEIVANGIDENKIVIGKPVTQAGASNTGYMDVDSLAQCVSQAHSKGWNGGVMGWQYSLDNGGNWINTLANAMN